MRISHDAQRTEVKENLKTVGKRAGTQHSECEEGTIYEDFNFAPILLYMIHDMWFPVYIKFSNV
jgi:hypothetical protein